MAAEMDTKTALAGEEVARSVGIGRGARPDLIRRPVRQNGVGTDDR